MEDQWRRCFRETLRDLDEELRRQRHRRYSRTQFLDLASPAFNDFPISLHHISLRKKEKEFLQEKTKTAQLPVVDVAVVDEPAFDTYVRTDTLQKPLAKELPPMDPEDVLSEPASIEDLKTDGSNSNVSVSILNSTFEDLFQGDTHEPRNYCQQELTCQRVVPHRDYQKEQENRSHVFASERQDALIAESSKEIEESATSFDMMHAMQTLQHKIEHIQSVLDGRCRLDEHCSLTIH